MKKITMMLPLMAFCFFFGMSTVDAQQSVIDQRRASVQLRLNNGTISQLQANKLNLRLDQLQQALDANPNLLIGQSIEKANHQLTFTPRGNYTNNLQGNGAQAKKGKIRDNKLVEARKAKRAAAAQQAMQKSKQANASLSPKERKAKLEAKKGQKVSKLDKEAIKAKALKRKPGSKFERRNK